VTGVQTCALPISLRHDPAASRYAVGMPGSAREVGASMVRALTGRGSRLADLVSEQHLSGRLLDADAARRLLTQTLLTGEADAPEPGPPEIGLPEIGTAPEAGVPGAGGPRPHRWRSCHSGTRQHVSYWLRRWPAYGLGALQQALSEVPALSVTTAVVLARGRGGRLGLAATVRVTTEPGAYGRGVGRAVSAAAASCGARLVRMDGEHHAGVLATLPLGREPGGRWLGWHSDGGDGTSTILPVAAGGVALGAGAGDSLVAISCFTAERATRTTVIGDALLPRLLALRALGSGARLQVITAQPGGWVKLRDHPEMPRERMFVVRPGTQPPGGATRADPWMVIDDTGSLESAGSGPWQAVVTILGQDCGPGAVMTGQDAIVLQRTSAPTAAAAAAAVGLDAAAGQALADLPDGGVAVARPGAAVEFAWLAPDPVERELLAGSMRPG